MKTSIIKTIALGLAMTFSMGVKGQSQVIISQVFGGASNEANSAIEIYNRSNTSFTFGTSNPILIIQENKQSGKQLQITLANPLTLQSGEIAVLYSSSSNIGTLMQEMGVSALAVGSGLTSNATSNAVSMTDLVVTPNNPIQLLDGDGTANINLLDEFGDFQTNSTQYSSGIPNFTNYEIEFASQNHDHVSTNFDIQAFSSAANVTTATASKDDLEGFGIPPAKWEVNYVQNQYRNFIPNATNGTISGFSNPIDATFYNSISGNCVVNVTGGNAEFPITFQSGKAIDVRSGSIKLSANSSGQAKAKVKRKNGLLVTQEKFF